MSRNDRNDIKQNNNNASLSIPATTNGTTIASNEAALSRFTIGKLNYIVFIYS